MVATRPFNFEHTATLQWSWVQQVLVRNFLVFAFFYGGWHCFLYGGPGGGPMLRKLEERKFNLGKKSYHLSHDVFWSSSGMLISSAYEVLLLHGMATGRVAFYGDFWSQPTRSIGLVVLVPYWVEFHFYWIHRFLHEAPGFYRYVHYLHHRARSPGPFSGLSMHPVESAIFFSACLLCLAITHHPIHIYFTMLYTRISPISGHDGYDKPAGGSLVHYLHHLKVNVNYGTPVVPFDAWFGTLDDGTEFRKEREAERKRRAQ